MINDDMMNDWWRWDEGPMMIWLSTLLFMYPNIYYDVNSHPFVVVCVFWCLYPWGTGTQVRSFNFTGRLEGGDGDILP